jgi:predicted adenine nucleotide alpha hydrolase (AANH) superfamily ATPase
MKLLLHICCAPCSIECINNLNEYDVTGFWYNPNIHPYTEYQNRLNTLKEYSKLINLDVIYNDEYGLREFTKNVIDRLDNRCEYCYTSRLEQCAKYAKENGFDAFSTTLLISPYQKHDLLKQVGEELEKKYNIKFIYKDFREYFYEGRKKAKELNLYMQKYCGCIFSEEERYK